MPMFDKLIIGVVVGVLDGNKIIMWDYNIWGICGEVISYWLFFLQLIS